MPSHEHSRITISLKMILAGKKIYTYIPLGIFTFPASIPDVVQCINDILETKKTYICVLLTSQSLKNPSFHVVQRIPDVSPMRHLDCENGSAVSGNIRSRKKLT